MDSFITLRGIILSKFKTIGDFADVIKWSRNKASRIANSVQQPNIDDIGELVECLDIDTPEAFMQIFFAPLSTKWSNHAS